MSPRKGQMYPEDLKEEFSVTPLVWADIHAWHAEARNLREQGLTIRQIAAEFGKGFGPVQRLFNPDSRRRQKIRQSERAKERRVTDESFAKKTRTYVRRYMQISGGKYK